MERKNKQIAVKGKVFWFDPSEETKVDSSPLAVILSGRLHNKSADHLIITVASSKSIKDVRDFFEVACEVENKKIKVISFSIHAVGKDWFFSRAKYLGKLNKETLEKINNQLKLILELNS